MKKPITIAKEKFRQMRKDGELSADEYGKNEFMAWLGDNELNICDKCGRIDNTEELIWITYDGFKPLKNEVLDEKTYLKYDALCEPCYKSELIKQ